MIGFGCSLRGVVPVIEQYVTQRPAHLERCTQWPQVIATVENLSAAFEDPVYELTDTGTDAFHPARDGMVVLGFDQQMQMITLDRVMHDPKAVPDTGLS